MEKRKKKSEELMNPLNSVNIQVKYLGEYENVDCVEVEGVAAEYCCSAGGPPQSVVDLKH